MPPRTILPLAFALAAPLSAQAADVTYLGTGCRTPEGIPAIGNNGVPSLGQTFELFYPQGSPNHQLDSTQSISQPHLVVGFGFFPAVSIPQGLFPLQPAGCDFHMTHDVVAPMMPDPNGRNSFRNSVRIPIPSDPTMLGFPFFAQWMTVHTQCGFAGCGPLPDWIATSPVAICTIGN